MSKNLCIFCVNQKECKSCKDEDKLIPNDNIISYFKMSHDYVDGTVVYEYYYDSLNSNLKSTKSVIMNDTERCPYCGNIKLTIQSKEDIYTTIGSCCLCEGAINEIKYNEDLKKLNDEYNNNKNDLLNKYKDLLKYDLQTLFEIKQRVELKRFNFFNKDSTYNTLNTFGGKDSMKIEDILF